MEDLDFLWEPGEQSEMDTTGESEDSYDMTAPQCAARSRADQKTDFANSIAASASSTVLNLLSGNSSTDLNALRGINASVFVNQPAARAAFVDTVVRTVGYIAPTDVKILRVLRLEIALEQEQEQEQKQAQVEEQEQEQGYRRFQQPYVVSSPYPYPPLPRDAWDSLPPIHKVLLGSPFQLLSTAAEVQVNYNIAFIVEEVGFKNVTQAFDVTSQKLRSSVLSGAFEAMLVGIANNNTLNLLPGVSTNNVQSTIESVQVHIAPSSSPSSMPTPAPTVEELTTADKLVVVVSFLLVCTVMLISCFYVFNARYVLIFLRLKRRQQVQVLDESALKQHDKRMQGLQKKTELRKPGGDELDKPAFPADKCDNWEEKTETDADGAFRPDASGTHVGSPIQLRDLMRKPAFSSFVRMFDYARDSISAFSPGKHPHTGKVVPYGSSPPLSAASAASPASPPLLLPASSLSASPPPSSGSAGSDGTPNFGAFMHTYSQKSKGKAVRYG
ncbi:hypothetical protein B484DRAFT_423076 [Ochromonadaceae sp. CCMP2298]|nr:hypothetical protein B484DRAFT_423076 [Ochromonadaceae sp. CCMP2298]